MSKHFALVLHQVENASTGTYTHVLAKKHKHPHGYRMYAELCTFPGKVTERSTLLLPALECS